MEHGRAGELLGIAIEFSRQHAQHFVDDGFGDYKLDAPFRSSDHSRFRPSTGERERRYKDIAVENYLHRRRNFSRSFSDRMPLSFALRLQWP